MEGFLLLVFASLAAVTASLELFKRRTSKLDKTNRGFERFKANYVLVYALMMGKAPQDSFNLKGNISAGCSLLPYFIFCPSDIVLVAAGDWLQGPYVYALYQFYGFDRGDIGRLFIGGFASSMLFGTLAGSLADK